MAGELTPPWFEIDSVCPSGGLVESTLALTNGLNQEFYTYALLQRVLIFFASRHPNQTIESLDLMQFRNGICQTSFAAFLMKVIGLEMRHAGDPLEASDQRMLGYLIQKNTSYSAYVQRKGSWY